MFFGRYGDLFRPALHQGEQKHARGVVFYTSILFLLGVLFGYYMVAPLSVQFLGNYQVSAQVANQINLNSFIYCHNCLFGKWYYFSATCSGLLFK